MAQPNIYPPYGSVTWVARANIVPSQIFKNYGTYLTPCKNITITSLQKIELTKAKQDLICGDPSNPGWKTIPDKQATYFIKIFLGSRGYWQPLIETKDGRIEVNAGIVQGHSSL